MLKKRTWAEFHKAALDAQAVEVSSQKPTPMKTAPISSNPLTAEQDIKEVGSNVNLAQELDSEIKQLETELAFILQGVNTEQISLVGMASGDNVAQGAGSLQDLLLRARPIRKRDVIKRAYFHYERDDLLGGLIDLKTEFAMSGLNLQVKPIGSDVSEEDIDAISEFQSVLNMLFYQIDLTKLIHDLLRDWFISESMILYWQIDPKVSSGNEASDSSAPGGDGELDFNNSIPGLIVMMALNPATVQWDNSLGADILYVDVPHELREKVKQAFWNARKLGVSKDVVFQNLVKSGIGPKWINAIMSGSETVKLDRKDGDYWSIRTKGRNYNGLTRPSMENIFVSLETRNLLVEGDFSVAFMMKHFIQLIKQGESITQGPLAGSTRNYITIPQAKNILKVFSGVAKAMRAAVNHTTSIEFVFPPKEMFDPAKYAGSEQRIFGWSGVVQALMTGDGQNYGGGFIGIKKLVSKISRARNEVMLLMLKFFMDPIISRSIGKPEGYLVATIFDTNNLKEPAQLLNEVKLLLSTGVSDPRTAARELDRDPDALMSSKIRSKKEQETLHVWEPVVQLNNAGQFNDPGGRPPAPGTTPNEETRTQSPSGRTTQNS